jgi:hypothetical protein
MSFDMETPSLSSAISRARPACTPVLKSTRELRKPCKNLAKRGSRWVHLSPKRVSMHREGSLERSTRLSFILKHSSLSLTPLESVPCTSKAPTRWRTCTAALCHTRLNAEPPTPGGTGTRERLRSKHSSRSISAQIFAPRSRNIQEHGKLSQRALRARRARARTP